MELKFRFITVYITVPWAWSTLLLYRFDWSQCDDVYTTYMQLCWI